MPARLSWTGGRAVRTLRSRLGRNMHSADEAILDNARHLIGTHGPPRSVPGQPPHVDSGRLIDSLYDEVDSSALESRIGSSEEHAVYMEIGTPTVAARPWFEPAILASVDEMARRLAK